MIILIVDDSLTIRQMVSYTLTNMGKYEVREAADGVQALALIDQTKFDCVITDLNMPNMDGITLIENIRKSNLNRMVPILMLTTESDQEKKTKAKNAGATGWLVKPFEPEKLLQTIRKVCP